MIFRISPFLVDFERSEYFGFLVKLRLFFVSYFKDRFCALQDEIRREAVTMSLTKHPNLVKAHCSFVVDQSVWVVMPFMAGGSCLHIMKSNFQDGFEEPVIAAVLKECLKALEYLHRQGHIHRDVKVGK